MIFFFKSNTDIWRFKNLIFQVDYIYLFFLSETQNIKQISPFILLIVVSVAFKPHVLATGNLQAAL